MSDRTPGLSFATDVAGDVLEEGDVFAPRFDGFLAV